MTNYDLVQISKCIKEIFDSKEIKAEIKNSGKLTYALNKTFSKIEKILIELNKDEVALHKAVREALKEVQNGKDDAEIKEKFSEDMKVLMNTVVDVELHKIPLEECEIIQKYLSGDATITLFNFLTQE